tara:strand:+ start:168 stop:497 length:330 start_codon:yes stop_codon:yes gene_type:complete
MNYKKEEIKEYAADRIKENIDYDNDYLNNDLHDIHHDLFNSDYYIIGIYEATKWLKNEVFNVIEYIKEYENLHFGEVTTDFSSAESVVNMYVYIIGEEILQDVINEIKN